MKALVCIDVQNDFVTGPLGGERARAIAPKIIAFAKDCRAKGWTIYATADTHKDEDWDKPTSVEAVFIPRHCIEGTYGHQIIDGLVKDENGDVIISQGRIIDKGAFASEGLYAVIKADFSHGGIEQGSLREPLDEIVVCGLVTDICVISNALALRSRFPNVRITVREDLCAGTTEEKHREALSVMRSCLIDVVSSSGGEQ